MQRQLICMKFSHCLSSYTLAQLSIAMWRSQNTCAQLLRTPHAFFDYNELRRSLRIPVFNHIARLSAWHGEKK
jgi:hypothetical protein